MDVDKPTPQSTTGLDRASRALAAGAPRRALLTLLGAAAAGLLARARPSDAQAYRASCTRFVLAGGPDITDPIHVDDDLKVTVAGRKVKVDNDGVASILRPIWFAAERGDELRIVATDVLPPARKLGDVFLHCRDGGGGRWLIRAREKRYETEEEWRRWHRKTGGVFVDETFTV